MDALLFALLWHSAWTPLSVFDGWAPCSLGNVLGDVEPCVHDYLLQLLSSGPINGHLPGTIKFKMTLRLQMSTRGPSDFFPLSDFRGKVLQRAPELVPLLPSLESDAQAEVQEFAVASDIHQDALRLQI